MRSCPGLGGPDGVSRDDHLFWVVPGLDAALAAQPFAVQQLGAGDFHPQPGTAETVDRLLVPGLGFLSLAEQRS
jgi:hypothetical protein